MLSKNLRKRSKLQILLDLVRLRPQVQFEENKFKLNQGYLSQKDRIFN